jgi:hypothetical protein
VTVPRTSDGQPESTPTKQRKGGWTDIIKSVRSRVVGPGTITTTTKDGELRERTVTALARAAVLLLLAGYCDEDGTCFPSQDLIAAVLGVDTGTIRRALHSLEADGLISRSPRWREGGDGGRLSDLVTLNGDAIKGRPQAKPRRSRPGPDGDGLPGPGRAKGLPGPGRDNPPELGGLPGPGPWVTGPGAEGYRAWGPGLPGLGPAEVTNGRDQGKGPKEVGGESGFPPKPPYRLASAQNEIDHAAHARTIRGALARRGVEKKSDDVEPKEAS